MTDFHTPKGADNSDREFRADPADSRPIDEFVRAGIAFTQSVEADARKSKAINPVTDETIARGSCKLRIEQERSGLDNVSRVQISLASRTRGIGTNIREFSLDLRLKSGANISKEQVASITKVFENQELKADEKLEAVRTILLKTRGKDGEISRGSFASANVSQGAGKSTKLQGLNMSFEDQNHITYEDIHLVDTQACGIKAEFGTLKDSKITRMRAAGGDFDYFKVIETVEGKSKISNSDFSGASMRGFQLNGAQFHSNNLEGANLTDSCIAHHLKRLADLNDAVHSDIPEKDKDRYEEKLKKELGAFEAQYKGTIFSDDTIFSANVEEHKRLDEMANWIVGTKTLTQKLRAAPMKNNKKKVPPTSSFNDLVVSTKSSGITSIVRPRNDEIVFDLSTGPDPEQQKAIAFRPDNSNLGYVRIAHIHGDFSELGIRVDDQIRVAEAVKLITPKTYSIDHFLKELERLNGKNFIAEHDKSENCVRLKRLENRNGKKVPVGYMEIQLSQDHSSSEITVFANEMIFNGLDSDDRFRVREGATLEVSTMIEYLKNNIASPESRRSIIEKKYSAEWLVKNGADLVKGTNARFSIDDEGKLLVFTKYEKTKGKMQPIGQLVVEYEGDPHSKNARIISNESYFVGLNDIENAQLSAGHQPTIKELSRYILNQRNIRVEDPDTGSDFDPDDGSKEPLKH